MKKRKYIVWSYCDEEKQTFVDIVKAKDCYDAEKKVKLSRPYATLDSLVVPTLLSEYIVYLVEELEKQ